MTTTESSTTESSTTESVVGAHLQAFLQQQGIAAMLTDYAEGARLITEARIYQGKQEIHEFFTEFIAALPAGALDRFELISMRVDGNIAFITWRVGIDIPLGTDTFIVSDGQIVAQTYAMHAGSTH